MGGVQAGHLLTAALDILAQPDCDMTDATVVLVGGFGMWLLDNIWQRERGVVQAWHRSAALLSSLRTPTPLPPGSS